MWTRWRPPRSRTPRRPPPQPWTGGSLSWSLLASLPGGSRARRWSEATSWRGLEGDAGEHEDAIDSEVVHGRPDAFPAGAGVLDPAVGHLVGAVAGHVADDDAADVEGPVGAERGLQVVGEHAGLQAEPGGVHRGEGLVVGVDGGEDDDRPEHLLGAHLGVRGH